MGVETFSALLALYEGNPSVTGGFPSQRQLPRSFDVFFDLCLNKKSWANNRDVGDLRRHRAHYGVAVMVVKHLQLRRHVIPTRYIDSGSTGDTLLRHWFFGHFVGILDGHFSITLVDARFQLVYVQSPHSPLPPNVAHTQGDRPLHLVPGITMGLGVPIAAHTVMNNKMPYC